MGNRLNLAAGPHGHFNAVASFVVLLATQIMQIGQIVIHHLVVVLVIARGKDNALLGIELDIAIGALGDNARDAAFRIAHELLRLGAIENLDALLFGIVGQGTHTVARVIGLRAEIDGQIAQRIPIHGLHRRGPLLGRVGNLGANLLGQIENPRNRLAGILGPQFNLGTIAAELVLLEQRRYNSGNARGVGTVKKNARGGITLRNRSRFFLDKGNGRASLFGGNRGRNARGACANNHDVVFLCFFDISNGLGRRQERRRAGTIMARNIVGLLVVGGGVSAFRFLLARRRAAREHRSTHGASSCHATDFEQIPTAHFLHDETLLVHPRFDGAPHIARSLLPRRHGCTICPKKDCVIDRAGQILGLNM